MSWVALAWAFAVAGASFTALLRALLRRRTHLAAVTNRLVLVRPCAGHEPGLSERLASSGGADLVVLAVESALDPAATHAHRAARALTERGVDAIVVHTFAQGPNHKAAQLAKAIASLALHGDDVVIVADSDVDLERTDMHALVAPLARRGVGAAWAPPVEAGAIAGLGDRVARAVLDSSLHAFPLLAGIDRTGMVGKLFAVRACALVDAGGFDAFVDRLGEDVALARALRGSQWSVETSSVFAPSVASGRSTRSVVARLARWVQVVRSERPWLLPSYPLLFAPTPLGVAVLGLGITMREHVLVAAGALVLASRLAVARGSLRDVVLGDVALLAAFVRALASPTFEWRGRTLRIGAGGTLMEKRPRHPRQQPLGESREERRAALVEDGEVSGRPARARVVDARELAKERIALLLDGGGDGAVVRRGPRASDRDPQLGRLGTREDVPDADRDDLALTRAPRDVRGAGLQLERGEGGALTSFGEDPHRTAWLRPRDLQEIDCVTNGAGAVARIPELDAECADEREERQPREVSGVHHRVGLEAEEIGEEDRDERIPPRRVVRDDEERPAFGGGHELVASADEHASEAVTHAPADVSGEPPEEERGTLRGDHRRRP